MMHLERYVTRIKPAIEGFINDPRKDTLSVVEKEIEGFNFGEMRIYQVQTVVPLVVKLNDLTGESQELRTGLMNCLINIVSHTYLADEKGLRSILVVVLQQIRDSKGAVMRPNLSEEIKLAAVLCIHEALVRSTTDVLEAFYTNETVVVIGQILLTLLEIIEHEKYRKLVQSALQCLMVLFYVHNESDRCDVVLRSQVANTIFIFLPKVLIVLFKTSLKDEKVGETIKSMSIQALGRIICIMFEETTDEFKKLSYDVDAFRNLFKNINDSPAEACELNYFGNKGYTAEEKEERLHQIQKGRRSLSWVMATSRRIRPILVETSILRAHTSPSVRGTYADMCCLLLRDCAHNLRSNFFHILESVLALSEDDDRKISQQCKDTLLRLQQQPNSQNIFDENAELLLDAHLNKWPRILHRCEDNEQFAELLFLKGFLRNVNAEKLQLFFLVPKNLEMFVTCLLMALDLRTTRDLLNEEYSLRRIQDGKSKELAAEFVKLPWRQFKHVSSKRTVDILSDIAELLGAEPVLNRLIFDYCQDLILQKSSAMNESILLLTMMVSPQAKTARESRLVLAQLLLEQLLRDEHWSLALQPDASWRLKVDKPTQWFEDRTPGLYSSAVEVRTQDCDSDDEQMTTEVVDSRVSIADAQFNVLHTCLILDAVGHCARFIGDTFDRHTFMTLHRVLLKLASSNTIVHHAATFAFVSMQLALKYAEPSHFIECSTDYITFHLNALLKRSTAAVDILTVVLQYSSRGNVPHLDSIFQTIREECSKSHQTGNVQSYLRVFNAFLKHVTHWHGDTRAEINAEQLPMQVDEDQSVLSTWLHVLEKPQLLQDENADVNMDEPVAKDLPESETEPEPEPEPLKPVLPRHIEIIKDILTQVIKFVSTAEQSQQIVALECFASGVPLLADYENELLPLVHLIWEPLVEKFRQKDALVLNRCFTLLHLLGIHAKDFIAKRSLSDVIPQLKQFLKVASVHSRSETPLAQTQEYKLQLLLLQSLGDLILGLQLEGRHLHELLSTVALYLSQAQPPELQTLAREFFLQLSGYNGPFVYVTLLQRAHLKDSKTNVSQIFASMGFSIASGVD